MFLATVLLTTACAPTTLRGRVHQPAVVPTRWTAEYDYASGIHRYLRSQFDNAIVEGATPYIYIYADSSEHCRMLRRLMDRKLVSPLLRDVRISMLDYWRLHDLHKKYPEVAFDPGISAGVFVRITKDGTLSEIFYAELFLNHPYELREFGYPHLRQPSLRDFAAELQRFFEKNAENQRLK